MKVFYDPDERQPGQDSESKPKRLVLLLDGTRNKRKSKTNIGRLEDQIAEWGGGRRQIKCYRAGVGVKWHETIRGGAFGRYMSRQARQAYEFIKNNYQTNDEVFVFGFSRGAFASHILVGFCEWCGLLKPDARLSTKDLFRRYLDATRNDQEDKLEEALSRRELENNRNAGAILSPSSVILLEDTIEVPIKFFGVFDTVRSAGLEALMPNLWRDPEQEANKGGRRTISDGPAGRLMRAVVRCCWGESLQENDFSRRGTLVCRYTRHLPRIVESAFQALAIDEHRPSFAERVWILPKSGYCPKRIEQRWFIGSHANVGGGYKGDELHLIPLYWMKEKARQAGLHFNEDLDDKVEPRQELIRDSFDEFLAGTYKHLNERRFRPIKAERVGTDDDRPLGDKRRVNETIDKSVLCLASGANSYSPKNLLEAIGKLKDP